MKAYWGSGDITPRILELGTISSRYEDNKTDGDNNNNYDDQDTVLSYHTA
jgi:hypothetical protein